MKRFATAVSESFKEKPMRWLAALLLVLIPAATALARTGSPTEGGDVARGEEIYLASCAMCHGADATGMMGMHPALTGVVDRLSREGVEVTIRNGRRTRPPMPAFEELGDADINNIVAYLDSLPDGPRNFAHEDQDGMGGESPMMDGEGMGGMMDRMMGGGNIALWIVVIVLTAALAGIIGYLIASRSKPDR